MINSRFPKNHDDYTSKVKPDFNTIEVIDRLFDLPEDLDVNSIYNLQIQYWSKMETADIINKVKEYFELMPSARKTAFYLVGTIIHEDLNCAYLAKEKIITTVKFFKVHSAVSKIYDYIFTLFEDAQSRSLVNDTLDWSIRLCAEVASLNRKRIKSPNTMEELKTTDSGVRLLDFVERTFDYLVFHYSDDVFIKLIRYCDIHRLPNQREYDWLIKFFLSKFTTSIILRFFKYGGRRIQRLCEEHEGAQLQKTFEELYSNLTVISLYLQQTLSLEMNVAIEQIFDEYLNDELKDNFVILFILKVCCSIPAFFDGVMSHILSRLNPTRIIKLCSLINDPNCVFLSSERSSFLQALKECVSRINVLVAVEYLDILQTMAFLDSILDKATNLNSNIQETVRDALRTICCDVLNNFIRFIHDNKKFTLNDLAKFKNLQTDNELLKNLIEQCLQINAFGDQRCKLLHTFCIIGGSEFVTRVFAIFLCAVETSEQLNQFTAFATTVVLYYPSAMLNAIKDLVKKPKVYDDLFNNAGIKSNIFRNITLFLHWSNRDDREPYVSMFGLRYDQIVESISLAELVGLILKFGLSTLLSYLEDIKEMDHEAFEFVTTTIESMYDIRGVAPIEPGLSLAISRLISAIYVRCLLLIDAIDPKGYAGVACLKLNNLIKHILIQKWEFPKHMFLAYFVKEIFTCSSLLFGNTNLKLTGLKDDHGDVEDWMLPDGQEDFILLHEYRDTTARIERASKLIHSGAIPKRPKIVHDDAQVTAETLRCQVFIYTIHWLITDPTTETFDAIAIREICHSFNDVFFSDKHHSTYYHMSDWYEERNFLGDHVEVAAKIDQVPAAYHFMALIAEAPYPSFFCLASPITAQLGNIVNQCELETFKDQRVHPNMFEKIERLFCLMVKAGIMTSLMPVVLEMIRRCTMHEASALLIEIWRILTQLRPIDEKTLHDQMSALSIEPKEVKNMPEPQTLQLLKLMNIIFQRNPEVMHDLGSTIISFFPEETDDDNTWDSGPLFPVISFNEALSRRI